MIFVNCLPFKHKLKSLLSKYTNICIVVKAEELLIVIFFLLSYRKHTLECSNSTQDAMYKNRKKQCSYSLRS